MKKLLAMILGGTGMFMADTSESSCPWVWFDEPSMPKRLIEK